MTTGRDDSQSNHRDRPIAATNGRRNKRFEAVGLGKELVSARSCQQVGPLFIQQSFSGERIRETEDGGCYLSADW